MPRTSALLPAIGHAASGAGGTALSTLATYPLDLVNTRLKVQRQLRADGIIRQSDAYAGILDAFASIYSREGGVRALFAGLGADLGKSVADSFLFFLFYTWFRSRRLAGGRKQAPYLRAVEELAVGATAGACAKAFTTPVSNVVTRRQTASLLGSSSSSSNGNPETGGGNRPVARDLSFGEILSAIYRDQGLLGLWSGYSASLVLTLNPSITFFLQHMLRRVLVPREKWDEPGARTTFLLAAMSKVVATAVTYPFQVAKARMQVSAADEKPAGGMRDLRDNSFATVLRIARAEGPRPLYDGIGGELLKGFFSHGTTMLSKEIIHRFIVQLYFAILAVLRRYSQGRSNALRRIRASRDEMRGRSLQASLSGASQMRRVVRYVEEALQSAEGTTVKLLSVIYGERDR